MRYSLNPRKPANSFHFIGSWCLSIKMFASVMGLPFGFAWSSIEHGGTSTLFNFIALLALSNAGVPAHFFHLMEAPTMRLPNVKMLLCWPSRMHIYGFVENHVFLEQFVSMGVPAQFSNLGVPAHFSSISLVQVFCSILWIV